MLNIRNFNIEAAVDNYNTGCSLVAVDMAGCLDTLDWHRTHPVVQAAAAEGAVVVAVGNQLDTAVSASASVWCLSMPSFQQPRSSDSEEDNLVAVDSTGYCMIG